MKVTNKAISWTLDKQAVETDLRTTRLVGPNVWLSPCIHHGIRWMDETRPVARKFSTDHVDEFAHAHACHVREDCTGVLVEQPGKVDYIQIRK
jgi:hypothetical protein